MHIDVSHLYLMDILYKIGKCNGSYIIQNDYDMYILINHKVYLYDLYNDMVFDCSILKEIPLSYEKLRVILGYSYEND